MRQKLNICTLRAKKHKIIFALAGLGLLALLLAGCGSSNASSTTAASSSSGNSDNGSTQSQANVPQAHSASTSAGQQKSTSGQYGPQYLVKSLQVTMEVQNPLQSANDLQQWVAFTDPQSTSDGSDYESAGGNQYTVTLTFLVDVAHYTQVETYLRDYAGQKGHTLDSLKESVQDVTNDYVDAESTLTNLRAEQQRLLGFMNQTQNVNDALNVEQQLTQVEGQINDIEAHLNALKGQTTFYTVTVTVQPVGSAPPPPPPPSPWSVVPIWQGAWSSVVAVWQILVAILIWLLAYSVYIIPAAILIWLIRKQPWKSPILPQMRPALAPLGTVKAPVTAQPIEDMTDAPQPVAVPPDSESD